MPGEKLSLKPPFEVEFPDDGVTFSDDQLARDYEQGATALSDLAPSPAVAEAEPIPEVPPAAEPELIIRRVSPKPPRQIRRRTAGPDDNSVGYKGSVSWSEQ